MTSIALGAFQNCTLFTQNVSLPICTSIGDSAFASTKITGVTATVCKTMGYQVFTDCSEALNYNFPELLSISNGGSLTRNFLNNTKVLTISMPKITTMGTNTVNNNIFLGIKTGCVITVPIAMQTINAGGVEPDLAYAIGTRSAVVTYV